MVTVQLMKPASRKLKITLGPATSIAAADPSNSPVPIDPPTATIAIWPALSWCLKTVLRIAWFGLSHPGTYIRNRLYCQRLIRLGDFRNRTRPYFIAAHPTPS